MQYKPKQESGPKIASVWCAWEHTNTMDVESNLDLQQNPNDEKSQFKPRAVKRPHSDTTSISKLKREKNNK